jgi:hypothetical protein
MTALPEDGRKASGGSSGVVLALAMVAGFAAFWATAASLQWPDLLDPQWRTRGQLEWWLEVAKTCVPYLVGVVVGFGVKRLLQSWANTT